MDTLRSNLTLASGHCGVPVTIDQFNWIGRNSIVFRTVPFRSGFSLKCIVAIVKPSHRHSTVLRNLGCQCACVHI